MGDKLTLGQALRKVVENGTALAFLQSQKAADGETDYEVKARREQLQAEILDALMQVDWRAAGATLASKLAKALDEKPEAE